MKKHTLQVTIYLTALLLAGSMFMPLTSFPVYGEASYYRIARTEALLIIIFALAAPALMLAGRGKWTILSPLAVWGVLLYPGLRSWYQASNQPALRQAGSNISSAMVDFSADLLLNIAQFHWGGIVMLIALMAFTTLGILYQRKS